MLFLLNLRTMGLIMYRSENHKTPGTEICLRHRMAPKKTCSEESLINGQGKGINLDVWHIFLYSSVLTRLEDDRSPFLLRLSSHSLCLTHSSMPSFSKYLLPYIGIARSKETPRTGAYGADLTTSCTGEGKEVFFLFVKVTYIEW